MTDEPRLDRTELEALRAAWQGLPAPEPAPELTDEDATTRAAVDWLARAWASLPVPQARPPRIEPRPARPPARLHRLPRWPAAAAAALLAVLLAVPLLIEALTGDGALSGTPVAAAPSDDTTPVMPGPPAALPPASSARLLAVGDDRVDLRSGNVRLTLFTPPHGREEPRCRSRSRR